MFLLVFDGVNVGVSGPVSELKADGLPLLKACHVGNDVAFAVLHHGIAAFQHPLWMRCLQGGLEPSQMLVLASHRVFHASVEAVMELIDAFFGGEHPFGRGMPQAIGEQGELLAQNTTGAIASTIVIAEDHRLGDGQGSDAPREPEITVAEVSDEEREIGLKNGQQPFVGVAPGTMQISGDGNAQVRQIAGLIWLHPARLRF